MIEVFSMGVFGTGKQVSFEIQVHDSARRELRLKMSRSHFSMAAYTAAGAPFTL